MYILNFEIQMYIIKNKIIEWWKIYNFKWCLLSKDVMFLFLSVWLITELWRRDARPPT